MTGTYDRWNTQGLWEMVRGESEADTERHLNAWEQKQQLLTDQARRLGELRDRLAQHWNPTGSPAAQSFMDQLKAMKQEVEEAAAAAGTIRQTYKQIADAIQDARRKLEPLQARYNDHQAARMSDPLADWLPDRWVPDTPNVLAHYQRGVDQQARSIMEQMDHQVAEAAAQPVTIRPMMRRDTGDGLLLSDSGGSGGGGSDTSGSGSHLVQPPFDVPATISENSAISTPEDPREMPVLAGTPAPTTVPPFQTQRAVPPVISSPGPWSPPVITPLATPLPSTVDALSPKGTLPGQNIARTGSVVGESENRPFANTTRSIVPEDGVVRGGPAMPVSGRRPSTLRAAASEPHVISAGQRPAENGGWHDSSYEAYIRRNTQRMGEQDNQWTVKEGVPPVLMAPSPIEHHDAPPGVIGLDR